MEKLNPSKFNEAATKIYSTALSETIELLTNNEKGAFIALPGSNWVSAEVEYGDDCFGAAIWAVGVKDNELFVKATPDEGEWAPDIANEWIEVNCVKQSAYPDIYRFVAEYLDQAVSEEEADEVEPGSVEICKDHKIQIMQEFLL